MDSHFNGYKVKYDKLNQYLRPIKYSRIINTVNIFVNLDDLFHMMHKPLINNEFQASGKDAPKQFMSNIFNLLAHYRFWCIKNNLDCNIFGIYSSSTRSFKNNIYITEYRTKFKDINSITNGSYYFINETIKQSLPLLSVISNYIPGVYLIDSKYIEPSIVPLYIARDIKQSDWNILISRDSYDLQYAYRDKWSMICPKGEYTQLVNREDIWNYVNNKERIYKEERDIHYPFHLYILAKAVVGDRYRSIPRLRKIGWKTLFKILDSVIINNPDVSDITLQNKLIAALQGKHITDTQMNDNMNSINIDLQLENLMEIDKTGINLQITDVIDYDNLQELNKHQFSQYPLNLQFLCNQNTAQNYKTPFN